MKVKQVAVPMDFGVENLASPNHVNVSLRVANGRDVKANSLILSYNSRVFKKMFKENELCESVDLTECTRHVVDKFVKILYSGEVDYDKLPPALLREIWKLADYFNVKWLLKQSDLYLRFLIEECMDQPTFSDMRYIFEEANFFKTKKRRHEYMLMATDKLNSLRNGKKVKKKFMERYVSKTASLKPDQIDLLLDFAGENDGDILFNVIYRRVAKNRYITIDKGSREILRRINLAQCLESDMDRYVAVFGNKDKYRNLTPDQVDELRRLEENSTNAVFRTRPELRDAFIQKKRRLIRENDELPSTSFALPRIYPPTDVDIDDGRVLNILNSRLKRKRRVRTVISIRVKRSRPDLHFRDDSGDPDDEAVVQLLEGTDKIPNIVFSFPEELRTFQTINRSDPRHDSILHRGLARPSYTLDDVIEFFLTSKFSFKNMYMFVEYAFLRKAVSLVPPAPSDSVMVQYINNIRAVKQRHSWKKVSKEFVKDIMGRLMNDSVKKLLGLICESEELTSTTEAVEIISWRGARSTLRSRKYYDYNTIRMGELIFGDIKKYKFFWKHPDITGECSEPGRCGFVFCVLPISKSFNIRLSTRPEDYSGDIHCHPELLDAKNMHFVLRRDFSTKGKSAMDSQRTRYVHVTWNSKPMYQNNHVYWCGEQIPDNAYIALIVYYSFGTEFNEEE